MEVLTLEAWRRRCDDILAENGKVGHTEKCNRVPGWLGRGGRCAFEICAIFSSCLQLLEYGWGSPGKQGREERSRGIKDVSWQVTPALTTGATLDQEGRSKGEKSGLTHTPCLKSYHGRIRTVSGWVS